MRRGSLNARSFLAPVLPGSLALTLGFSPDVTLGQGKPEDVQQLGDADIVEVVGHLGRLVASDARTIATTPTRLKARDLPILVSVLGGTALLATRDDDIHRWTRDGGLGFLDGPAELLDYLGRFSVNQSMGGSLWVIGRVADNSRLERAGVLAWESSMFTVLITSALKGASGRERPFESDHSDSFRPFGGANSFPSSHSAQAFSLATVLSDEFGWPASIGFYGVATLVALARIRAEKHWPSDTAFGAAVGISVGRILCAVHPHDSTKRPSSAPR